MKCQLDNTISKPYPCARHCPLFCDCLIEFEKEQSEAHKQAAERQEAERAALASLASPAACALGVEEGREFTFGGEAVFRIRKGMLQRYSDQLGWHAAELSFNSVMLEIDSIKGKR